MLLLTMLSPSFFLPQADVVVTVHNRMTDHPVDFVFEALSAPTGRRQASNKAASSPSLLW